MGRIGKLYIQSTVGLFLLSSLVLGCQTTTPKTKKSVNTEKSYGRLVQGNLGPDGIRGGTTHGGKVEYDQATAEAFENIQKAKTKKEKDRMAILAQTGDYKVTFEFVETFAFKPDQALDKPYYSWATEYIFPLESSENFISLQHVLVMTMMEDSGKETEPYVVKHWRQDWTYQAPDIFEFVGHNTWKKRNLSQAEKAGAWKQAVYQVDDSPRYQAIGKWIHNDQFSAWESQSSWRPLPRREHTVRSDYDVLDSKNRVTITPTGWVHEQDSVKVVVDAKTFKPTKFIARETGLNSYHRIKNYDFSVGKKYWQATNNYWKNVRDHWDTLMKKKNTFSLSTDVDGKKLYKEHFEFADKIVKQPDLNKKEVKEHAVKTIDSFVK